jgi:uncharacterized membrane protein
MTTQFWLVALSNSLHLFATILWIGWSLLLPLVVAPRAVEAHRGEAGAATMLLQRGTPLAYGALAVLGATGMLQMGANEQYDGMFVVSNLWSIFLLSKHLLIIGSVVIILLIGQWVSPQLRLAVRRAALGQSHNSDTLAARFRLLAWLNAILGAGVLVLTGFMTAL